MIGIGWQRPDVLKDLLEPRAAQELELRREAALAALARGHWQRANEALAKVFAGASRHGRLAAELDATVIRLGAAGDLDPLSATALSEAIRALVPWRKGPYELCGEFVDAEWRSDKKWERIEGALPSLAGARVLDVGCNSGYYMMRMLGMAERHGVAPEAIVGIDPSESFYLAFELMQSLLRRQELQYELLGVEDVGLFVELFDVVLCLGIVYHQRDPLSMLRTLKAAMRPGGVLILESQAIPGDEPVALFPHDRYAKARNVFFVPTASCMRAWLMRAGFRDIELVSSSVVTGDEQRRTNLAPYESLLDFLDPDDPSQTVEGYPAPLRVAMRAVR